MPIGPGSRLGPYEVTALIGEGGMGQVWRARHLALNRDDALKVLPDAFASDPERLARFRREAQVLASLNHVNIAHVYGLEQSDGVQALVMELVEGPTLADRIAQGPIPVDEALPIAKQIAEALEAAHEQGIIHRDLKPANIKLRPDGTVKVLDFGLAKALEPVSVGNANVTASPTITSPAMMTGVGVLLGTAAYMSPEQARGKTVDRRADIWAFGCVLYEMLTGTRPFGGEDLTDTIAAVVRAEPDWRKLPPATPPSIQRLLRRSLVKDARERLPDIGTARFEIRDAREESTPAVPPFPVGTLPKRARLAWMASAVVAAIAGTAFAALYFMQLPDEARPEMRVEINTPPTADSVSFAVSPDGRHLVFAGSSGDSQSRLWLRPIDSVSPQPLAGTEGATYPFWSPDSRSIAFFAAGKLMRLDLGGGPPQALADVNPGRGASWNGSGMILFAPRNIGPIFRVSATGGESRPVTTLEPRQGSHRFPEFLPDGRRFLFYSQGGPPDIAGVYLGSLDSPAVNRLTAADSKATYLEPGWIVFVRQGALVARRFDVERGELSGDPVTIADPVAFDATMNSAAFSVSRTGLVAYRGGGNSRRQLTWFDRTGKALGTIGGADESGLLSPELSPDGRRVGVHRTEQGNTDIWILDALRATRFTFDQSIDRYAAWSPDGARIAFSSNRRGSFDLYVKTSSGAGSDELLVESPQVKSPTDWSPDGRLLLYTVSDEPKTGYDLWIVPVDRDRKPFPFLNSAFEDRIGQFSPDARWIAYVSNESGRHEIYVRPFPARDGQWQISTSGGISPRWSRDGKELFYITPGGNLMATPVTISGDTFQAGTPLALFQTQIWGSGTENYNRMQYDVAPDGRFLINVATEEASAPITLLVDWNPERGN